MTEDWRDLDCLKHKYRVSSEGSVKVFREGLGYVDVPVYMCKRHNMPMFKVMIDRISSGTTVARAVAFAWSMIGHIQDRTIFVRGSKLSDLQIVKRGNVSAVSRSQKKPSSYIHPMKGRKHYLGIPRPSASRNVRPSLRAWVLARDRVCQLCGGGVQDGLKMHVDHIVPSSRGGKTEVSNLQALCHECNYGKGNRLFRELATQHDTRQHAEMCS